MRERSIEIPPSTALTCPSSDEPAPKGTTGAPARAAARRIALTSSVDSGYTTTSGTPAGCQDSL